MPLSIEKLAQSLGDALKKNNFKLVTAESCTGGGLGYWITSIPGSSEWFEGGFITYSDTSKTEMLGVNAETIKAQGAVSEAVVCEMANGALFNSHAEISIAITGIAGPSGGSELKPVGTVWIAVAKLNMPAHAEMRFLSGNRQEIRTQSIQHAIQMALKII